MSCRNYYWEWCHCYDFVCICGAPYKYDANSYHYPLFYNECAECCVKLPDISCIPLLDKISTSQISNQETNQCPFPTLT